MALHPVSLLVLDRQLYSPQGKTQCDQPALFIRQKVQRVFSYMHRHLHLCLELCDLHSGRLQLRLRIAHMRRSCCTRLRGRQIRYIHHLV
jgi:hypothetical protein